MDPAQDQKSEDQSTLNSEALAVVVRREPERDLVTWTAPARPFKRHDRQFYTTVFAMAGIISLVLFLAEGIMPVILIVALVFLYYVLSTVEPENIEYKVTTKGVKIGGKLTNWQALIRFWFGTRSGSEVLIFETYGIPGRIEIMTGPETHDKLKKEISAYIPYEEVPVTEVEKFTDWFTKKVSGNR
ncbi:MAG TPA: hypothetical protein VKC54_01090 [Patescibacteria group bacterium]|nr:hypothetical protein [Patescibacteria group bacterium]